MAAPKLGYGELVEGQAIPETTVNEMARYLEQGAGHFIIKDRDLATPPGLPAQGDAYYVAAAPTGAWAGHAGDIAFYMGAAWEFIEVIEGFTFWVNDENTFLGWDGAALVVLGGYPPYWVPFFFTTTPVGDEILLIHTFGEEIDFLNDFAGSVGDVGTNPTASFVLTISIDGSDIGTITIATGGGITFVTTGGALTVTTGQVMRVRGPTTPDATVANVSLTLKGAR